MKDEVLLWTKALALLAVLAAQLLFMRPAAAQGGNTYSPITYRLIGATSHVSGQLTNLQSEDGTYMSFGSYYYGRDTLQFVSGNTSDADFSPNKGTHSNFSAQQYGPDSINDALTEGNAGGSVNTTLIDGQSFEGSWPPTGWTETGAWNRESDEAYDGIYSADFDGPPFGSGSGDLDTPSLNCSDATAIYVSFYFRERVGLTSEFRLRFWNGSSWVNIEDLGGYSPGWHNWEAKVTDGQYFVSDFQIRWVANALESGESVYVDWVTVKKEIPADNYELDLEVQWTEIPYSLPNENLSIYGGTMGAEDIKVDVWNGTGWETVFTDLSSGWNNASVTDWLTSSSFTIRFKGGTETGDSSETTWQIDIAYIHVWSEEQATEVEFTGLSDREDWLRITWTIVSAWTADSVNVTMQLYDYVLGHYLSHGNSSARYISSAVPDEDETVNQTITANPSNYRNSSGYWRLKISGINPSPSRFELKVDKIQVEAAFAAKPFDWAVVIYPLAVFGLLIPLALGLKRKNKGQPSTAESDTVHDQFDIASQQMAGAKILLEVDPTSNYHKAVSGFVSEVLAKDESLFIFTGKNSSLHLAFSNTKVRFFLPSSKISSSKRASKREVFVPMSDLSVLLDTFSKILNKSAKKRKAIVFDNLSDTILMCGFEKTYKFLRFLLETLSSPEVTALFIFNPTAHDPAISSSIRGLFKTQLIYSKKGLIVRTL